MISHLSSNHKRTAFLFSLSVLACCFSTNAKTQENDNSHSSHPLTLRIGANLSPNTGFAIGADYVVSRRGDAREVITRVTLDSIFASRPSLQSIASPVYILTLDQVFHQSGENQKLYFGAGVGLYSGPIGKKIEDGVFGPTYQHRTTFGGKLFVGSDFNARFGVEGSVHFTQDITLFTVQLRLKL